MLPAPTPLGSRNQNIRRQELSGELVRGDGEQWLSGRGQQGGRPGKPCANTGMGCASLPSPARAGAQAPPRLQHTTYTDFLSG